MSSSAVGLPPPRARELDARRRLEGDEVEVARLAAGGGFAWAAPRLMARKRPTPSLAPPAPPPEAGAPGAGGQGEARDAGRGDLASFCERRGSEGGWERGGGAWGGACAAFRCVWGGRKWGGLC